MRTRACAPPRVPVQAECRRAAGTTRRPPRDRRSSHPRGRRDRRTSRPRRRHAAPTRVPFRSGNASGAGRGCARPGTPSAWRLVASTRTAPVPTTTFVTTAAAAPSTCSQLSTTTSTERSSSASTRRSASGTPARGETPNASRNAPPTAAGSVTRLKSTNRVSPSARAANSMARRVLPTPPGPASVTIRDSAAAAASRARSASRPRKGASAPGIGSVTAGLGPCRHGCQEPVTAAVRGADHALIAGHRRPPPDARP